MPDARTQSREATPPKSMMSSGPPSATISHIPPSFGGQMSDFLVNEVFLDGTVRASDSDGVVRWFGLCIKADSDPPRLYLCNRSWNGNPGPDIDWLIANSLRDEIPV